MAKVNFDFNKFKTHVLGLVVEASKDAAYEIRDEIKQSMADSPEWPEKTYYRHGRKHHPSIPGNPPRVDYGVLHDSISVNWTGSGLSNGEVGSRAKASDGVLQPSREGEVVIGTNVKSKDKKGTPLWILLESGTRRMRARPFIMAPLQKYKNIIKKHIKRMSTKKFLVGLAKGIK